LREHESTRIHCLLRQRCAVANHGAGAGARPFHRDEAAFGATAGAGTSRCVELTVFPFAKASDIAPALDEAKARGAQAINFLATPHQIISRDLILDHMSRIGLPAIYQWPETPELGGLIGYGPPFAQMYRQRARQVAKMLRGAKPTEVPVEQPSNFELVINLRTAKAIGLEIPAGLVLRADRVIE
jgi:putative ABC transport system substrate-binding protein